MINCLSLKHEIYDNALRDVYLYHFCFCVFGKWKTQAFSQEQKLRSLLLSLQLAPSLSPKFLQSGPNSQELDSCTR